MPGQPKSLSKVQKHLQKRKGKTPALHENSRDSKRLRRAAGRDDKLGKLSSAKARQSQPYLDRVSFFQQVAQEHPDVFSLDEVHVIIQNYIKRDQEEIDTLQSERRPGRPATTRQDLLTQIQDTDQKEYASGFWVPDMMDELNLKTLREFSGDWGAMNQLKYSRVAKDGTVKASLFPPRKEV